MSTEVREEAGSWEAVKGRLGAQRFGGRQLTLTAGTPAEQRALFSTVLLYVCPGAGELE